MQYGEFEVTTKERKRALSVNVRRRSDAFSHDLIIPNDIRDIAGDIINEVTSGKKDVNGK